ncbi:hypothetical protein TNCV_2904991 [Trichonephila clavipes]|nr:hypothetical protein TNCV_2904991 [Trichonephila clavipes]
MICEDASITVAFDHPHQDNRDFSPCEDISPLHHRKTNCLHISHLEPDSQHEMILPVFPEEPISNYLESFHGYGVVKVGIHLRRYQQQCSLVFLAEYSSSTTGYHCPSTSTFAHCCAPLKTPYPVLCRLS